MNSMCYKWCTVPLCKNTSIATPNKRFIYVPNNPEIRRKWLLLAQRDPSKLSIRSTIYFCEDHFDFCRTMKTSRTYGLTFELQNDMENYIEYQMMGSVSKVRMKQGCLPTKFDCQSDLRRKSPSLARSLCVKKERKAIIEKCLFKCEENKALQQTHIEDCPGTSSDIDLTRPNIELTTETDIESTEPDYFNSAVKIEPEDFMRDIKLEEIEIVDDIVLKEEYHSDISSDDEKSSESSKSNDDSLSDIEPPKKINGKYQCYQCKKSFTRKYTFNCHVKKHKGQLPFKCSLCHKSFTTKHLLNFHQKTHAKDRLLFQCDECEKSYRQRWSLERHQKITHSGERIACPKCSKKYAHQSGLDIHMRSHTGERPYVCNVCNKSYRQSSELIRHKLIHNKKSAYYCEKCDKYSRSKFDLKLHMKSRMHKEKS